MGDSPSYIQCDQSFGLLRRPFLPSTRKHHTLSINDIERLGAVYDVDEFIDSQRGQHIGPRLSGKMFKADFCKSTTYPSLFSTAWCAYI